MSEVKLKLQKGGACDDCYYWGGRHGCVAGEKIGLDCITETAIWVIDEPQSPWVKIEDAELVSGEMYWITEEFDSTIHSATFRIFSGGSAYFDVDGDRYAFEVDEVSHVIHLPKPLPPVK